MLAEMVFPPVISAGVCGLCLGLALAFWALKRPDWMLFNLFFAAFNGWRAMANTWGWW